MVRRPGVGCCHVVYQDHVPMDLGGTDRRTIARSSTMRNGFYIRRVRYSFLSDNAHASAPHVSDLTHMREPLGGRLPSTDRISPAREHQRARLLPQYSTRDQKKLLAACSSHSSWRDKEEVLLKLIYSIVQDFTWYILSAGLILEQV